MWAVRRDRTGGFGIPTARTANCEASHAIATLCGTWHDAIIMPITRHAAAAPTWLLSLKGHATVLPAQNKSPGEKSGALAGD
jgi:hypothetical protein